MLDSALIAVAEQRTESIGKIGPGDAIADAGQIQMNSIFHGDGADLIDLAPHGVTHQRVADRAVDVPDLEIDLVTGRDDRLHREAVRRRILHTSKECAALMSRQEQHKDGESQAG